MKKKEKNLSRTGDRARVQMVIYDENKSNKTRVESEIRQEQRVEHEEKKE